MDELRFEWDGKKSLSNARKHGVSFEEASSAFYDENALVFPDADHSEEEDRFLLLGMSVRLRILIVCPCFRKDEKVVRIISARKADRSERKCYWRRP
ncbi:MAG: BrnT family toxin [Planctomycetes bacterium]|nr:BrnT family toxin [Planctomycetota bacterium]